MTLEDKGITAKEANSFLETMAHNFELYDCELPYLSHAEPNHVVYELQPRVDGLNKEATKKIAQKAAYLLKCIDIKNFGNQPGYHRTFDGYEEPEKCEGCPLIEQCEIRNGNIDPFVAEELYINKMIPQNTHDDYPYTNGKSSDTLGAKSPYKNYDINYLTRHLLIKAEVINNLGAMKWERLSCEVRGLLKDLYMLYSLTDTSFEDLVESLGINMNTTRMSRLGFNFRPVGKRWKNPFCKMVQFAKDYQKGKNPSEIAQEHGADVNYYDLIHFIDVFKLEKVKEERKANTEINHEELYQLYKSWDGSPEEFRREYGISMRAIYVWAWRRGLTKK